MKKQLAAGVACASLAFGGVAVATSTEASAVTDTGQARCRTDWAFKTYMGAKSQCWNLQGRLQRAVVRCANGTWAAGPWTRTDGASSYAWCPYGIGAGYKFVLVQV